ncbi:MAG: NADP-dependent malic enzyme [Rhodospirillaceae bacterium]|nr:NADP-dependent malic enzyme [Rhodospirillaceae bacterium]MYB13048.1 NADP-dependent malic enzyme [Rhodospirillaceae bacterium]MYI49036.1 NADP-dependent malic enzyme [Rhodospirillaceae bacterium]
MSESKHVTDREALLLHASGRPGKIEIAPTKPLTTQRDLSLAYSPGVAAPVLRISEDEGTAYDYTARGNLVGVISNGTAILGLGNLGALASKPVMEGKAVLFKRFADVDAIDLEVDTEDVDAFVNCVRYLGASFGGINLEDIKAPDCFIIEQQLRELLDIPVFHDDQHGTAIIMAAGLLNALDLTGRSIRKAKVVINGAGASGIACAELIKAMGVPEDHVVMCDTRGVIYQGREQGMNQWKSAHAAATDARTLEDAVGGADVAVGLSVKGAFTGDMIKRMSAKPIVFALANPDPEITPEEVRTVRADAIVATGRSDYQNQVNNVLGFPYIFRGALDVRASTINDTMKIAAAEALAKLAREDVPDEVDAAYAGRRLRYGPDYVIPVPFDPRLIEAVPYAVATAAMESGVARKFIVDEDGYRQELRSRLDPAASSLQRVLDQARANPRKMVFAEGEEERAIRAAIAYVTSGYGSAVLVGREQLIQAALEEAGLELPAGVDVHNARKSTSHKRFAELLYQRKQREGWLFRDCQRMVNQDRNVYAACLVASGEADAMLTGLTRRFAVSYEQIRYLIDNRQGARVFGMTMIVARGRTVFIADSSVNEEPTSVMLADIAEQAAAKARDLGHEPRVAFLSHSNFGNPLTDRGDRIRDAVALLDSRRTDFEYDGDLSADVALDPDLMALYPFCRLSGPANVLVMPDLDSANISAKLMQKIGGGTAIGPIMLGLDKPVQIAQMGSTVNDLLNLAAFAAADAA